MLKGLVLAVLLLVLGCTFTNHAPEPTPTLEPAPTPEVAPPKPAPEIEPEPSQYQADARDAARERRRAIRRLGDRLGVVADLCGDQGRRHEDEFGRLYRETHDAFDGDWVAHERRLVALEERLTGFVERVESECEKVAAQQRRRGGAVSSLPFYVLYALVAGGLCGRYMTGLTIRRGLLFGLIVSLATTALAAFIPFPGREYVPNAAWLLLAVPLTAAVCWRSNERGREGSS